MGGAIFRPFSEIFKFETQKKACFSIF
jgi:hypothetical protein